MEFNYFDIKKTSHLINEFYHLSYPDEVVPLESIILPLTFSGIAYIYTDGQKVIIDKETGDKTATVATAHKPNLFGPLWVVISPLLVNIIRRNFMKMWINILV